jgi:hypothetical protein
MRVPKEIGNFDDHFKNKNLHLGLILSGFPENKKPDYP